MHSGVLGWVAFITYGSFYWLIPRLWKVKEMYSQRLIAWHYWIATLGIVFYITSMWVAGIMEGLMWRAFDRLGFLQYSFIESVVAVHPFYVIRLLGGVMFLTGALIMIYNVWMTVNKGEPVSANLRPAVVGG